jgi:hypothetical protein
VLSDGSRVYLKDVAMQKGTLAGETLFGQKIALPIDAVVALDVMNGKATYLSDLKPKKVEQVGFLNVVMPWTADRGIGGSPLELRIDNTISSFDKGLGTRPRTVLTYDLAGKYRRFEALVGLDPRCGDRGSVRLRVLVDGMAHTVVKAGTITAGAPVEVRVDVTGKKELVLEVDFGPAGSVEGSANWADARLIE